MRGAVYCICACCVALVQSCAVYMPVDVKLWKAAGGKTRFHDMTSNILILLPCVEGGMKAQMDTRK